MSIMNRPSDGLLSVLIALSRALIAYGPRPEKDLVDLVSPPSIGSNDMARKTLTRWKQLGAFVLDIDGRIDLNPSMRSASDESIDEFRKAVLEMALRPENNAALGSSGEDENEASKASDLTRALSWALAQDPYSFPATWPRAEALQNEQGIEPKLFSNSTRWNGFQEWSVFLGFCVATRWNGATVNPSFPLRIALHNVLPSGDMAVREFVSAVSGVLPVMDAGSYRGIVDAQIARPWRTLLPNQLSASLSLGLLTLEAEGSIRLELRSDAPTCTLLGRSGRELRSVSHVATGGFA